MSPQSGQTGSLMWAAFTLAVRVASWSVMGASDVELRLPLRSLGYEEYGAPPWRSNETFMIDTT
jgi:hypothetical protein